jgi:hypothetical protein
MGPEGLQTYIEKKSIALPPRTEDRLIGLVDA